MSRSYTSSPSSASMPCSGTPLTYLYMKTAPVPRIQRESHYFIQDLSPLRGSAHTQNILYKETALPASACVRYLYTTRLTLVSEKLSLQNGVEAFSLY
jgi:hypothetical protein